MGASAYRLLFPTLLNVAALVGQNHTGMMFEVLIALSVGCLGFVPYWKSLSAKEFFSLHQAYGKKIYRFFAPLTIVATFLPLFTVVYGLFTNVNGQSYLIAMGFFTILFFSTYSMYFKQANKRFAEASIPDGELAEALATWGNWHWGRVALEFLAFACALALIIVG